MFFATFRSGKKPPHELLVLSIRTLFSTRATSGLRNTWAIFVGMSMAIRLITLDASFSRLSPLICNSLVIH